jgi:hypothetical protein
MKQIKFLAPLFILFFVGVAIQKMMVAQYIYWPSWTYLSCYIAAFAYVPVTVLIAKIKK